MDNIEKMYELAGVSNINYKLYDYFEGTTLKTKIEFIEKCNFTAEKQLKLIKWILKEENSIDLYLTNKGYGAMTFSTDYDDGFELLEQCLANVICCNWELLNVEQKADIKEILIGE